MQNPDQPVPQSDAGPRLAVCRPPMATLTAMPKLQVDLLGWNKRPMALASGSWAVEVELNRFGGHLDAGTTGPGEESMCPIRHLSYRPSNGRIPSAFRALTCHCSANMVVLPEAGVSGREGAYGRARGPLEADQRPARASQPPGGGPVAASPTAYRGGPAPALPAADQRQPWLLSPR